MSAMVPRTLVCPDLSGGLFSSPRQERHLNVRVAFDASDEAYADAVGTLGIFQTFDLKDLAKSADIYSRESGAGVYTPNMLQLIPAWQDQSIVFDTVSSIRAERLVISYVDFMSIADYADYFIESPIRHRLVEGGSICFGASFPLIQVQSSGRYELNRGKSAAAGFGLNLASMDEKAERLRSELFNKIGLSGNVWDSAGVGDLNIYAGIESHAEYFLRLRTLDLGILFGALLPTGMQRDQNCPASLPLSLSAVAFNTQAYVELGLKDYMHVGIMSGLTMCRPKHHEIRIPVYQEPAAFSPLLMQTLVTPGLTGWINPYLKISNIANNVHLTVNYACIWHAQDEFKDDGHNASGVASVLTRDVSAELYGTNNDGKVLANKKLHVESAWRTRHAGIALTYEPYQADKNVRLNPLFSFGCQVAHKGLNAPKMYHAFACVTLQF